MTKINLEDKQSLNGEQNSEGRGKNPAEEKRENVLCGKKGVSRNKKRQGGRKKFRRTRREGKGEKTI